MKPCVKYEAVVETIELLAERIKNTKRVDYLITETPDGYQIGEYSIIDTGQSYNIYHNGKFIKGGLYLLNTALIMVQMYLDGKTDEIGIAYRADKDFGKYENDVFIYKHSMEACRDTDSYIIAETKHGEAYYRMKEAKNLITSRQIVNNNA